MLGKINPIFITCRSSGLKPILTLSTTDGALLTGSDILRDVLNEEEIELVGNILSVDLPRLPERFRNLLMKHPELCERKHCRNC